MFLAEKGLTIPIVDVDLLGGENRRGTYLERNPGGQLPSLELDDGTLIAETVAIFEYLEELNPTPALIGTNPKERAETRMWQRRIELRITEHLYNGFRYAEGLGLFADRMRCLPEAAEGLKLTVQDNLRWLDTLIAGRDTIVPGRFTMADIILYCAVDFGITVGQSLPDGATNIARWFAATASRPSAEASLHAEAAARGMRG